MAALCRTRIGFVIEDRQGVLHEPLVQNDEDAAWTPILCGAGIVLPGSQRRGDVDCPLCLAARKTR